jgi:hypothetical protein
MQCHNDLPLRKASLQRKYEIKLLLPQRLIPEVHATCGETQLLNGAIEIEWRSQTAVIIEGWAPGHFK